MLKVVNANIEKNSQIVGQNNVSALPTQTPMPVNRFLNNWTPTREEMLRYNAPSGPSDYHWTEETGTIPDSVGFDELIDIFSNISIVGDSARVTPPALPPTVANKKKDERPYQCSVCQKSKNDESARGIGMGAGGEY